jgi:hypothetical protein
MFRRTVIPSMAAERNGSLPHGYVIEHEDQAGPPETAINIGKVAMRDLTVDRHRALIAVMIFAPANLP